jgi:hypothetical protein
MPISTIGQNGLNAPLSLTSPNLGTPSALVLTNATGLPQAGLATNVAGNGPAFSAYNIAVQTVTTNVATKVSLDTEVFDTNNNFASGRFTPTVAGYYQITAGCQFLGSATPYMQIYKNGSAFANNIGPTGNVNFVMQIACLIYCNGSSDYIEIYATSYGGTQFNGGQPNTWATGAMIRAA